MTRASIATLRASTTRDAGRRRGDVSGRNGMTILLLLLLIAFAAAGGFLAEFLELAGLFILLFVLVGLVVGVVVAAAIRRVLRLDD